MNELIARIQQDLDALKAAVVVLEAEKQVLADNAASWKAKHDALYAGIDNLQGQIKWRIDLPVNNDAGVTYSGNGFGAFQSNAEWLNNQGIPATPAADNWQYSAELVAPEQPAPIVLQRQTYDGATTEWSEPEDVTFCWTRIV